MYLIFLLKSIKVVGIEDMEVVGIEETDQLVLVDVGHLLQGVPDPDLDRLIMTAVIDLDQDPLIVGSLRFVGLIEGHHHQDEVPMMKWVVLVLVLGLLRGLVQDLHQGLILGRLLVDLLHVIELPELKTALSMA